MGPSPSPFLHPAQFRLLHMPLGIYLNPQTTPLTLDTPDDCFRTCPGHEDIAVELCQGQGKPTVFCHRQSSLHARIEAEHVFRKASLPPPNDDLEIELSGLIGEAAPRATQLQIKLPRDVGTHFVNESIRLLSRGGTSGRFPWTDARDDVGGDLRAVVEPSRRHRG